MRIAVATEVSPFVSPRAARSRRPLVLFSLSVVALLVAGCGTQGGTEDLDTLDDATSAETTGTEDATVEAETQDDTTTPDTTDSTEPQSNIGIACDDNAACGDGAICATLLPGGYCTQTCEDGVCPTGSVCSDINGFAFCKQACESSEDCRDGYQCLDGTCDIECVADTDCAQSEECVAGGCQMRAATQELGESCTSSAECLTRYCSETSQGGVCVAPCGSGSSCALEGWTCQNLPLIEGGEDLRLCAPEPERTIEIIELDPQSQTFTFTVPDDAVSFMIVAESGNAQDTIGIYNLRNPAGTLVAGWLNNVGFTEPFRINPGDGHGTVLVPNNSETGLQMMPGTWRFEASVFAQTFRPLTRVQVLIRRAAGGVEPTDGTIDLNVMLPIGVIPGVDASNAGTNAELSGAIERLRELWAPHGLRPGRVRYYNIPADFVEVRSDSLLRTMFSTQSSVGAPEAYNIFIVDRLLSRGTAGIAGGIPGPHGVAGTGGSGVAVELQGSGNATGDDVTHELGHYMGWYHVSESPSPVSETTCTSNASCPQNTLCMNFGSWGNLCALSLHDVISDTAECTWTAHYEPCMNNIMYPALLTGSGVVQSISAHQGRVGRLSPIAH